MIDKVKVNLIAGFIFILTTAALICIVAQRYLNISPVGNFFVYLVINLISVTAILPAYNSFNKNNSIGIFIDSEKIKFLSRKDSVEFNLRCAFVKKVVKIFPASFKITLVENNQEKTFYISFSTVKSFTDLLQENVSKEYELYKLVDKIKS